MKSPQATHPILAGFLADAGAACADALEPPVHSVLDHWVSLSILFVVACGLLYASAQGWLP